ncbi:thiopurine S-methyltransferase [Legionella oakridgensis]|uniref:Thiopurine S-methyltransferase n=2 Tax=Legionella oakridgensis TaxID=29423 RepID=W0B8Q2_9GAMM|nr:thiopurine S-methyltransferase [Legionella oakridgensis]AHE66913.1 thiopurine S-methyltransferase, Se/Te detoxification family [Legionella oakridgensis ATCC 33761 = DSM 21215]ETO93417.1 thiopurine S-methyltransferase, Se/Te detoxification family [Legionella oakridgensis RV-2-2007]KTD37161.1 thiopurine S-methyltransferase [Legionella oakridgensis]STY20019.1 thiopurine S-methyltransferase [Legionella longbeachae]
MKAEYWQQKWQSNEIGFNQAEPNQLMQRYFSCLNLESHARIFVPLCGKSIDMLWLSAQGYEVIGVELSQLACDAFFKENNKVASVFELSAFTVFQKEPITLFAGDFFQLSKKQIGQLDAVYDRAALIALPTELRKRYVAYLLTLLDKNTQVFLIVTSYDQRDMEGPPFSVDEQEVKALYGEHFNIKQLYKKIIKVIPDHLHAKGLKSAIEQVYCLQTK